MNKNIREKFVLIMFIITSIFLLISSITVAYEYPDSCSTNESKYLIYDDFETGILNLSKWSINDNPVVTSNTSYSGLYSLACGYGQFDCMYSVYSDLGIDTAVLFYLSETNDSNTASLWTLTPYSSLNSHNTIIAFYTDIAYTYNYYNGIWNSAEIGESKNFNDWIRIYWKNTGVNTYLVSVSNSTNSYEYNITTIQASITPPYKLTIGGQIDSNGLDSIIYYDKIMVWNTSIYGDTCPYECYTEWIDNSTSCNGRNYTKIYYDSNNCGTLENLPVDNGTIINCSLENWVRTLQPCINDVKLISYTDTLNSNLTYHLPLNNNTYENCTSTMTININSNSLIFTITELDILFYIILGVLIYFPFYMNNKKYFALYIFVGMILGIYTIYLESKLLSIFVDNTFFVNLLKWILLSISLSFFAYGIVQGWSNLMDMIFGEKTSSGKRMK